MLKNKLQLFLYLPKYGPYWCYPGFSETLHCMFTYLRKTVKFVAYMIISLTDKVLFILRNLWPLFFRPVMQKLWSLFFKLIIGIMHFLRYHPPSSTLLALIGASAFAFNKYPHKLYIFWKLNSSRLLLIPFKKSKY